MSRIRSIKPEILDDEKAAHLSDRAWRLWVSMWLIADDHGRLHSNARRLHGQALWAKDDPNATEAAIAELADAGLIRIYQVNGETFAEVPSWERHQKIDHRGKPRVPVPDAESYEILAKVSRDSPEESEIVATDLGSSDLGSSDLNGASGTSCSELVLVAPASEPDEPPLLTFSTVGPRALWPLTRRDVEKWQQAYPHLDVLAECRRASAWLEASPERRKTAKGMPKFLIGWFGRANDRAPSRPSSPSSFAFEPARTGGARLRRMAADLEAQARAGPATDRPALPDRIEDDKEDDHHG